MSPKLRLGKSMRGMGMMVWAVSPLILSLSPALGAEDYLGALGGALPPAFTDSAMGGANAMSAMGSPSVKTSCNQNTIVDAMSGLATLFLDKSGGGGAAPVSMSTPCPVAGQALPSLSSCDELKIGGKLNQVAVKKIKAQLDAQLYAAACEVGRYQAIAGEVECLRMQKDAVQNNPMAQQLQQQYSQFVSWLQQQPSNFQAYVDDTRTKANQVDEQLKKLQALEQETRSMVKQLPTKIGAVREQVNNVSLQRKSFLELKKTTTAATAKDCFNTRVVSSYRCDKNGASVSARDYLLCRYEQNRKILPGGQVDSSSVAATRAAADKAQLAAALDSVFGAMPTDGSVPASQDALGKQLSQATSVLTAEEAKKRLESVLKSVPAAEGLDITSFATSMFSSCFTEAQSTIDSRASQVNTDLGKAKEAVNQAERQARDGAQAVQNDLVDLYERNSRALSSLNKPLDLRQCTNVDPAQQVGCLQNLEKLFRNQLSGTGAAAEVVKLGNRDEATKTLGAYTLQPPGETVSCRGLYGCVAELEKKKSALAERGTKLETMRPQFSARLNSLVEQTANSLKAATGMDVANKALESGIGKVNSALEKFCSDGSKIEVDRKETGAQFGGAEFDPSSVPGSYVDLMAARMNPAMISDFKLEGGSCLADKEAKLAEAKEKSQQLGALLGGCLSETRDSKAQALEDVLATMAESCVDDRWCKANASGLGKLAETLDGLTGAGLSYESVSSLDSGTICSDSIAACDDGKPKLEFGDWIESQSPKPSCSPSPSPQTFSCWKCKDSGWTEKDCREAFAKLTTDCSKIEKAARSCSSNLRKAKSLAGDLRSTGDISLDGAKGRSAE